MRKLIAGLTFPFLFGFIIGLIFNNVNTTAQNKIQSAITGFVNIELFNICALAGIMIVSVYVIFKGEIVLPLNRIMKIVLYGLPTVAFGACVPFFAALSGFLIGLPSNPEKWKLILLDIIGFIWTAGFLTLLLVPAHAGFYPADRNKKKGFYIIVLISSWAATAWYYSA